jgi:drug/metabolite transporter (DMT)-like permease
LIGLSLGLGAALFWGFADYAAAVASRETGALRVLLGLHLVAMVLLGVASLATGDLARVQAADLPGFALTGALGWLGYLAFYRALAIGPISVVSPIVSGYAAVTVLLAVVLLGERLGPLQVVAVTLAFVGVALASSDLTSLRVERVAARGPLLGLVAMVALGGFVYGVAARADELGWLAPLFFARAVTTALLAATALRGGAWRFPHRSPRLLATLALLGVLDTGGYVAFNLGVREADTAVVATASAPYAVVPIVMGVLVLAERPARSQWWGMALVLTGVVLLALAAA